ncbi:MAG: hypothetical protein RPS47_06715 [Colwellia sp.]
MPQYNMHSELNEFYNKHVRLKDEIKRLRELRDTNLNRLEGGLKALEKPVYVKSIEQGSISMHTANKAPNNDYDIDLAVIFEKDDLPASPLDARKRVANAINEKANGFSREPEARTNAVTVWYADGYHVDIAVYRRSEDYWGNETLEHAGTEWAERDPKAITDWFIKAVKNKSPSEDTCVVKPEVELGQMRRIVRWIKSFTKAREGWNLPGGLVISTLVSECYQSDRDRDDIALYNTIVSIKNRLDLYCAVYNPTDNSKELTEKQKFLTQVKNLKKRFGSVITKLEPLFKDDCTDTKAKKSWNYIFQHDYWNTETTKSSEHSITKQEAYVVALNLGIAKSEGGRLIANDILNGRVLPKRSHLKFVASTNVPMPYNVNWRVSNSGVEAENASDMGHISNSGQLIQWETTAYRGRHEMICEIIKSGEVVASAKRIIKIAS